MSATTQTTLLARLNFGTVGLVLLKVLGTPTLGAALLVLPYAWTAGWLPIKSQMPLKLQGLLSDDAGATKTVFASTPRDPNRQRLVDFRYLWRVELNSVAVEKLVVRHGLRAADAAEVPEYFWNQFPVWWPHQKPSKSRFFRTAGWEPNARGENDFNFLVMYDDKEGVAYFWVKDNF